LFAFLFDLSGSLCKDDTDTNFGKNLRGKKVRKKHSQNVEDKYNLRWLLFRVKKLFSLARVFCEQLESKNFVSSLAELALKNLLFLSLAMYRASIEMNQESNHSPDGDHFEFRNENIQNDPGKEKNSVVLDEDNPKDTLHWVFRRLSYMSKKSSQSVKRKTFIFRWFSTMAMHLSEESLYSFLVPILVPLFKAEKLLDSNVKNELRMDNGRCSPKVPQFC